MKGIFVEKITHTTSNQDSRVVASNVPPIIAPSLWTQTVVNTEMEKKSVYLGGKFFEKDKINGKYCLYCIVQFLTGYIVSTISILTVWVWL